MKPLSQSYLGNLTQPDPASHKGENGVLYIVAGSRQYHGSLWFAVEIASHFVDLIYVETDPSNRLLHPAMILVSPRQRTRYLAKSDCVLLGPGLGRSRHTERLVKTILNHPHRPAKVVIDADALHYIQPYINTTVLSDQCVITPHASEYRALFGTKDPQAVSKTISCIIVKKSAWTQVCQNGKCQYNTKGSAGLTKGGTGDVLASLIAALACTNPVSNASCAAVVLLGIAGADLAMTHGTHFSIRELINQIPVTLYKYQRYKCQTRLRRKK